MKKKLVIAIFLLFISLVQAQINVQIDASRTDNCVAPCAVFFDATGTTSSSTSIPFHELHYKWTFGDSGAGDWAVKGTSKNTAIGAVAAHVFDPAPGSGTQQYTVELIVTDGVNPPATDSVTITVSDPNVVFAGTPGNEKTRCVSTDGNFSGCPPGADTVESDNFSAQVAWVNSESGRRLLFKRGNTWTTSSEGYLNTPGPGLIGAYGNCINPDERGICGNAPIIRATSTEYIFRFTSTDAARDWRIMDLELEGGNDSALRKGAGGSLIQALFYRLYVHDNKNSIKLIAPASVGQSGLHDQIFIVNNHFFNASTRHIWGGASRYAILGNLFDTSQASCTRHWVNQKKVLSNNKYVNPGTITVKMHSVDAFDDSEYVIISDNDFPAPRDTGSSSPNDIVTIAPQSDDDNERLKNVIVERNLFKSDYGETRTALKISAREVTVRNNLFQGDDSAERFYRPIYLLSDNVAPNPQWVWIYGNSAYRGDYGRRFAFVSAGSGVTNVVVRNNISVALQSNTSDSGFVEGDLSGFTTSNNVAYFPNNTSKCIDVQGNTNCVDPMYISTNPSSSDFLKLDPSSSGIDAGYNVPVLWDYERNIRPQGAAFDLGGFEGFGAPPECPDGSCNGSEVCGSDNIAPRCNADCGECPPDPYCGDGSINQPSEDCDGNDFGTETCETQGFDSGNLICTGSCTIDTSSCIDNCGNGTVDEGEDCDSDDLDGNDCTTIGRGFDDGILACNNATCEFDTSQCTSSAPSNLVHHYPLEGNGNDVSGNGFNGTVSGASLTAGQLGNAMLFDGTDDYISFDSQNMDTVTIAAWVRADGVGESDYPRILESPAYTFYFRNDNSSLSFVAQHEGQASHQTARWHGGITTIDGTWYHVAVTYDSTSLLNDPILYINGQPQTAIEDVIPSGNMVSNSGTGYIGNNSANSRTWDGAIDELRIYNEILSQTEIQALYDTGHITNLGDLNDDFYVDVFDLVIIGKSFGKNPSDSGFDRRADTDNDDDVDIIDLKKVADNFGAAY